MAKRMMATGVCILLCLSTRATITNIVQCIDQNLTATHLSEFPDRDNSTSQSCLLGFIKGSITGDYLSFLAPLSDTIRIEEAGTSNLTQITSTMTNQFHAFAMAAGFSNHVVRAYSEAVTNNVIYSTTYIQSQCGLMNKTNKVYTVIQATGGSWRIVEWDVDE